MNLITRFIVFFCLFLVIGTGNNDKGEASHAAYHSSHPSHKGKNNIDIEFCSSETSEETEEDEKWHFNESDFLTHLFLPIAREATTLNGSKCVQGKPTYITSCSRHSLLRVFRI